jgi:hypothetical protein
MPKRSEVRFERIVSNRQKALLYTKGREPTDEEVWESFTVCPVCEDESLVDMSHEEREAHIRECVEEDENGTIYLDRTRNVRGRR